ncbi:MAG: hypothetical protein AAGA60_19935 [Cyanobacteria bacterium P01_E01_bin.42]
MAISAFKPSKPIRLKNRKKSSKRSQLDYAIYRDRPLDFFSEVLQKRLTPDQIKVVESVQDNAITLVPSSHGQGKTAIGAWLVLWWVYCVGGLCITTAPTQRQVKELLWGEVRKAIAFAKMPGVKGQLFVTVTENARAYGFTAADWNSNAFQGIHAEKLLVIIDEACGISEEIWDGATSCITGSQNRFLSLGNPILSDTPFEKAIAQKSGQIIRLPAWRHPNVADAYKLDSDGIHRLKPKLTDPTTWPEFEDSNPHYIPGAISIYWIEMVARSKGEKSSFWLSRIEAVFPTDSEQSIIPRSYLHAARARYDENPDQWQPRSQWRHGLDVGDGGDAHGLASWNGNCLFFARDYPCQGDREDVTRIAGIATNHMKQYPGIINVDNIGVGAGTLACLRQNGMAARGINWGEASSDPQFLNLKAEMFWAVREGLRLGLIAIAPLGQWEDAAFDELVAIRWEETATGKIRIEDKKKTIKRLKRSPNIADAIVYGYWKILTGMLFT